MYRHSIVIVVKASNVVRYLKEEFLRLKIRLDGVKNLIYPNYLKLYLGVKRRLIVYSLRISKGSILDSVRSALTRSLFIMPFIVLSATSYMLYLDSYENVWNGRMYRSYVSLLT
ncbi:MAG: hypothetical protein QXQ29_01360 [Candidatus Bathyarchaeia archaeon]